MEENKDFLTEQIITYIGNKRSHIYDIETLVNTIKAKLEKDRCICADLWGLRIYIT